MIGKLPETAVELPASDRPFDVLRSARLDSRASATLLLIVAVYAGVAWLLTHRGEFWSPDSAVRFVQVESLRRAGLRDLAVPYPAEALDPEGQYFPAGPWFHFMRSGKHYLAYAPYFSMLAAAAYEAVGWPGLILWPSFGGILAVVVTYGVLRSRARSVALPAAVTLAVGTPLLIYSGVFWDHTLAVGLAAAALGLIVGRVQATRPGAGGLVLAGALLGLGTWLRNEMYLLTAAATLVWLVTADRRVSGGLALATGAVLTVGLQWMINVRLYGAPMGYKGQGLVTGRVGEAVEAGTGRLAPWISDKLGNFYYQLVSPNFYAFDPVSVMAGTITAALLLGAGLAVRAGIRRRVRWLVLAGGAAATATAILVTSSRTSISGLLPAMPFVILLLVGGLAAGWERYLWRVCALFAAGVIATGTHGGLQWGPRYLLPIVPPLVWLVAAVVARVRASQPDVWPSFRLAAGLLVGAGILVQVAGVEFVEFAVRRNGRVNEALRGAPAPIVVTSLEWLVLGAGPVYFEKQLMYVDSLDGFKALVARLSDRRVGRWAYVPRGGGAYRQRQVEEWTAQSEWRFRVAQDTVINGIRVVVYEGGLARR